MIGFQTETADSRHTHDCKEKSRAHKLKKGMQTNTREKLFRGQHRGVVVVRQHALHIRQEKAP